MCGLDPTCERYGHSSRGLAPRFKLCDSRLFSLMFVTYRNAALRSAPAPLGDGLQGENLFRHTGGKVHKQEVVFVIEVILAAFVNNPHQIILGRCRIGKNPINLAGNERRLIVRIVNAKNEGFG